MDERNFPPPPPRPETQAPAPAQEPEKRADTSKKSNLRMVLLILGAVVAFLGATVCGYFLFG